MKDAQFKIEVVGFSQSHFDQETAENDLRRHLETMFGAWQLDPCSTELVSGLTNMGVPRIAYRVADELRMITVGYSAQQAKRVRCGTCPVAKTILVGENFGDESQSFVNYIDALIRIGGGQQSRHEVELFGIRLGEAADIDHRLIESEVDWFGKPQKPENR